MNIILDQFVDALLQIKQEAQEKPEFVTSAPHTTLVSRLDDIRAVRKPVLKYSSERKS